MIEEVKGGEALKCFIDNNSISFNCTGLDLNFSCCAVAGYISFIENVLGRSMVINDIVIAISNYTIVSDQFREVLSKLIIIARNRSYYNYWYINQKQVYYIHFIII